MRPYIQTDMLNDTLVYQNMPSYFAQTLSGLVIFAVKVAVFLQHKAIDAVHIRLLEQISFQDICYRG